MKKNLTSEHQTYLCFSFFCFFILTPDPQQPTPAFILTPVFSLSLYALVS